MDLCDAYDTDVGDAGCDVMLLYAIYVYDADLWAIMRCMHFYFTCYGCTIWMLYVIMMYMPLDVIDVCKMNENA